MHFSIEFKQISVSPLGACERWRFWDSIHSSTWAGAKFEITPTPSRGIISVSPLHCWHHDRSGVRPRRISNESLSIVIFVCFAMQPAF